jgi:type III secretion protein Y
MWANDHQEVLQVLADVFVNQGQPEKAVVLLEAIYSLQPQNAQVIKALSYAYLSAGRYEQTLTMADVFLRLRGATADSNPILLIRSKALWSLGRAEEARASLNRYIELGGST